MDFIQITIIDIVDILVVAVILYQIYRLTRGTHTPSILMGILIIYLLWVVVRALNMELLSAILGHIIGMGVLALAIVFQPEIRRFLHMLGTSNNNRRLAMISQLFDPKEYQNEHMEIVHPIVKACLDMSNTKTGALIVIQQESDLSTIAETGVIMDAKVTSSLIRNVFFKNSPLHDGAMIITDGRIKAAKCILPSTAEPGVPDSFGMRHRAALGMAEISDAVVVVVSEETGAISIFHKGEVQYDLDPNGFRAALVKALS